MKQIFTFSSFLILLIHSSCISTHTGSIQTSSFAVNNNFKIVSTIEGESEAIYILGIGGNMKNGLINEAKKNMYLKTSLLPNQNITNITTDIKRTFFIFPLLFMSQTAIVSADVIEFYNGNESVMNNDKLQNDKQDINKVTEQINNENVNFKLRNTQNFNDTLINKPYLNLGEVKIGDSISVLNSKGNLLKGTVKKVKVDGIIVFEYLNNIGKYIEDESDYSRIRKIKN